jgi:hypothetical protein
LGDLLIKKLDFTNLHPDSSTSIPFTQRRSPYNHPSTSLKKARLKEKLDQRKNWHELNYNNY